jgi:aminoglycoside phosphotransferase (APT) family kinase protein
MTVFNAETEGLITAGVRLDLQNFLIGPTTLRLTALLDFDFSHIASSADEFSYSVFLIHGIPARPFEDAEHESIRLAQLDGFVGKDELPANSEIDWQVARTWDEKLGSLGA